MLDLHVTYFELYILVGICFGFYSIIKTSIILITNDASGVVDTLFLFGLGEQVLGSPKILRFSLFFFLFYIVFPLIAVITWPLDLILRLIKH